MRCLNEKTKTITRSATLSFKKDINQGKHTAIKNILEDGKKLCQFFIDFLWENEILFTDSKKNIHVFNRKKDLLDCPSFISTVGIEIPEKLRHLQGRFIKAISTQACGIVKSKLELRRKRLFVVNELEKEGKTASNLVKKLDKDIVTKPVIKNFNIHLDSNNSDIRILENERKNKKQVVMDGFIQLSAISKKYGRVRIPIRFHRQINKWRALGEINSGIILSKNSVTLSFSVPRPEEKEVGRTVGVDQGIINVVTFSDGQTSGQDKDGHTLQSIQNRLSRRKKGSKRFEKAQRHRENYIGWALNSLDLSEINDIRLEKIYQIRKGKKSSRFLSHWTATKIAEKLERLCEENGVRFSLQSCAYRSQRCSACGFVHEKNRKKKVFRCLSCGFLEDADFNASLNHEAELPSVPIRFIGAGLNKGAGGGFYWKERGFFHTDGSELTVPSDPILNAGFP